MITACSFISDPLSALQYGRSRTTVMWIKRVTPEDMLRSDVDRYATRTSPLSGVGVIKE